MSEVVGRFTWNTITNHRFSVNPIISILLKIWFLNTYYLSNSFLQSQARKGSCSHSLRLYMFRCLDKGLDNSHQCLKKKKRTLSGLTAVRYPFLKKRIIIQDSFVALIKGIQFYSTRHSTREILLKLIWPKLKMARA